MERPNASAVLGTLVAAGCPVALFVVAGPLGGVVSAAALLVWLVEPAFGFALGQFGLVASMPDEAALPELAVAEVALFALLGAGLVRDRVGPSGLAGFAALSAVLAGGTYLGTRTEAATWLVALALAGAVATLVYGMHRYELVAMELVAGRER